MIRFEDDMPGPVTQELPIVDYPHLPRIEVERRAQDLASDGLELVLRYEREHGDRTPVVRLLTARLRQLRERGRDSRPPAAGGYGPAPGPANLQPRPLSKRSSNEFGMDPRTGGRGL